MNRHFYITKSNKRELTNGLQTYGGRYRRTLLNNNGQLTENNKNAIRQWVDKGLIFTIASGRPVQGVEN